MAFARFAKMNVKLPSLLLFGYKPPPIVIKPGYARQSRMNAKLPSLSIENGIVSYG